MTVLRRKFLGSIIAVGFVAGCGDFPAGRILDIQHVNVEDTDSNWTVEVTVRARNNLDPGGFHNVTVVGYSASSMRVCSVDIGELAIGARKGTQTVKMNCSTRPVTIGMEAVETSCDEDTIIEYINKNQTMEMWQSQTLECGGSLPPE